MTTEQLVGVFIGLFFGFFAGSFHAVFFPAHEDSWAGERIARVLARRRARAAVERDNERARQHGQQTR